MCLVNGFRNAVFHIVQAHTTIRAILGAWSSRTGVERRGSAGVGEFIHKRPSEGVNGCACERTSETASAFLLACRPVVGSHSVSLSPTGALFSFSLSPSFSRPFFLPVPPLFYSVDYPRLYDARQPFPSPRSRTECNDRSVGILHSRCIHRFPSSQCTIRSKYLFDYYLC